MFVQDLKLPGTNVTAEISREGANNFIQMCNRFASSKSHEPAIDDYLMKLSQIRSINTFSSRGGLSSMQNGDNNPSHSSMNVLQNLKVAVASNAATPNGSSSISPNDRSRASSIAMTQPISTQKLFDAIDVKQVSLAIPAIAVDLVYRMVQRCFTELEIQAQLTRNFKELDSSLEVMPFGSATYGFGGSHTNFNILMNAGALELIEIDLIQMII